MQCDAEVWRADADGSNQRALTANVTNDFSPSWSPDGRSIAFASDDEDREFSGQLGVFTMGADGNDRRRLTTHEQLMSVSSPRWSPDGSLIAFGCQPYDMTGFVRHICVVRPDGSGFATVTTEHALDDSPEWSPDGESLLFLRSPSSIVGGPQSAELWRVAVDGSGAVRLSGGDTAPNLRFSPDGRRVVFALGTAVMVARADGGPPRELASARFFVSGGDWSPDGEEVVFGQIGRLQRASLIRISLADGKRTVLMHEAAVVDWSLPAPAPVAGDTSPPSLFITTEPGAYRVRRGLKLRVQSAEHLHLGAFDTGGIGSVRVGIARLGHRPVYADANSAEAWRTARSRMRRGRYVLSVRAADAGGHEVAAGPVTITVTGARRRGR